MPAKANKRGRAVEATVNGRTITSQNDLERAMGNFGRDIVRDDFSDSVTGEDVPNSFRFKAKELKNFQGTSVLGMLKQYGYLEVALGITEEEIDESDSIVDESIIRQSLKAFQKRYRLEVTGDLTDETKQLLATDRCGVKDVEYESSRAKRYVTSKNKWDKTELTYWYNPEKMTGDLPIETIKRETEESFQMWADHAGVTFREVAEERQADLTLSFEDGDHGDNWPFSGPGGVLAHAAYPTKGWLHFDDAEDFTSGTSDGIQFKQVVLHELGHNLGLKHSDVRSATMFPYYFGYTADLALDQDDILGIEDRLGKGKGTVIPLDGGDGNEDGDGPGPTEEADINNPPRCLEKIDAAFRYDKNPGYVYVFSGQWYYRLKPYDYENNNKLPWYDSEAGPKRIQDGFPGLPSNLDAVVENINNANQLYAFKGDKYFLFDTQAKSVVEQGTLADLWPSDPPSKIEGAFRRSNSEMGFLSGDKMWKYKSNSDEWAVAEPNSNYFASYPYQSISLGFYNRWTWIFQGNWYSVVRNYDGKVSAPYTYRPIINDIGLPMCSEGVGSLTTETKKKCKKELKKYKKKRSYKPSPECLEFIAENYSDSIDVELD